MASETWRLLLAFDGKAVRPALRQALAAASCQLDEVHRTADVHARLPPPGDAYDCLLIGDRLADASAETLIFELRARGVATPVLAVLGQGDEAEALTDALLAAGASDYLLKSDVPPDRLLRRLRHAIHVGRLEADCRAAQTKVQRAAQERDELLSLVSHDLRSPLNAIRIAADELIDPNLDLAARQLMVAAVQRSLRRADRLICDLLDVSRIESGSLTLSRTAVSAKELLEQARRDSEILGRDSGLEVRLEVDADVGLVRADRERILQVLENLLSNAARHARGSGVVTLAAHAKDDLVEISITDRGPGIPAEQLAHLFDRFHPERKQQRAGVGLGLAIVKGIVAAHGGTITAASTPGQGASFVFSLPRAD